MPPTMPITDRLPLEILIEIVAALSRKDQLSLCRVSQLWNELCINDIYRLVSLGAFPTAKIFLESKQNHTGHLRFNFYGLTIHLPSPPRLSVPPGVLHHPDMQQCFFPYAVLIPFLGRHPGLTHLRVTFNHVWIRGSSPPFRVHLPSLLRFSGQAMFVPELVTQQLRIARLHWDGDENIEETGSWPDQETLDPLTMQLPRFKMLRYLALEGSVNYRFVNNSEGDRVYALVLKLAGVCPTLEACCIRRFAFRKNAGAWEDFTRMDFRELTDALVRKL
ncbi:hypothetical protein C8R45DRAFT_1080640 [Mycena sanguinolenta]|nr:hypothetical protein C8R45DRAFT_1080640 [Mycena sanguinolenta]